MAYLKLYREPPDGKAVRGKLYVAKAPCPSWEKGLGEKGYEFLCPTLENLDYLIPPLIYPLTVTYSPKFKRPLPLVNGVPKAIAPSSSEGAHQGSSAHPSNASGVNQLPEQGTRSGIRFHPGTRPEHSRGCILVSRPDEEKLKALILSEKETRIEIN